MHYSFVNFCVFVQIKTYVDKNAKNGQEYAQQELSNVTLPSSFSTTFDPWSVKISYCVVNSYIFDKTN